MKPLQLIEEKANMLCLEVTLNDRRIHTAGVADGLLNFTAVLRRQHGRMADEPPGVGRWHLSGFTYEQGFRENVTWAGITELSENDVITLRVIRSARPDEPVIKERAENEIE